MVTKCSLPGFVMVLLLWLPAAMPLQAEEKSGLLVEISKKTVSSRDKVTVQGVGNMSIDKDMVLKLDVTNSSMKELPALAVDSVALIQRWGFSETERIERYTGHTMLEPLHPSGKTSVQVGQYHIGGHMHGSSDRHVDHVLGWKVVITRDNEKIEFTSSPTFEAMDRRAKPATARP